MWQQHFSLLFIQCIGYYYAVFITITLTWQCESVWPYCMEVMLHMSLKAEEPNWKSALPSSSLLITIKTTTEKLIHVHGRKQNMAGEGGTLGEGFICILSRVYIYLITSNPHVTLR